MDELAQPGSFMVEPQDRLADRHRARQGRCRPRVLQHLPASRRTAREERDSAAAEGFVCGYHGWTYSLDGKLINLRDKRDFVGLNMAERSLTDVRCERFFNWVFINEDPDAQPLLEHFRPVHGSTSSSSSRSTGAS